MSQSRDIVLNDGHAMPRLGLGVWQTPPEATADAVATALAVTVFFGVGAGHGLPYAACGSSPR